VIRSIGATSELKRLSAQDSKTSGAQVTSEDFVVERKLIDELLAGSAVAWESLVDGYGQLIRSRVAEVACAMGRRDDWAMIDDVTAEVFSSLVARDAAVLRCFRGQSRLSTYLAVIATRIARRAIAKQLRQSHSQIESMQTVEQPVSEVDPQATFISLEDRRKLLSLVDRLPEKQKRLVVAFYQDEQTYVEISKRFEIPVGSIGTTLRRAEQRLRNWIDDENE